MLVGITQAGNISLCGRADPVDAAALWGGNRVTKHVTVDGSKGRLSQAEPTGCYMTDPEILSTR